MKLISLTALVVLLGCDDPEGGNHPAADGGRHEASPIDAATDGSAADPCSQSDPQGTEGQLVLDGCPCTRPSSVTLCCPVDRQESVQCYDGRWQIANDGCNPPPCAGRASIVDGGYTCSVPATQVRCEFQ